MKTVCTRWLATAALLILGLTSGGIAAPAASAGETLRITVRDSSSGEPIAGAVVHMAGEADVTTGGDGVAVLPLAESTFIRYVKVKAAGFEPKLEQVTGPNMTVYLKELKPYRTVRIYVKHSKNGKLEPLEGAQVEVFGASGGSTDEDGFFKTQHTKTIGDDLRIRVKAPGYVSQDKKIIVGAVGVSVTSTADAATFILEPAQKVTLTVEVLDSFTDNPIPGAQITLYKPDRFPGTTVAAKRADSKGEASFDSDKIDEARIQGAARVGASHASYENAVQDVPADILEKAEARYLLFLKPKSAFDLSGNWRLTWTWTVTSVDFVGTVTQSGADQFTFQGLVESGGNAIWTARKGSGHASCSLTGKPGTKGKMSCTVTFPDKTWQGQADGPIVRSSYGAKSKLYFEGRYGKGTSSDAAPGSKPGNIDTLELSPKN